MRLYSPPEQSCPILRVQESSDSAMPLGIVEFVLLVQEVPVKILKGTGKSVHLRLCFQHLVL